MYAKYQCTSATQVKLEHFYDSECTISAKIDDLKLPLEVTPGSRLTRCVELDPSSISMVMKTVYDSESSCAADESSSGGRTPDGDQNQRGIGANAEGCTV